MLIKNKLVLYQGGGYDGCFWEYNFFLFDVEGNFHNLFTSGYAGIKTEKQAIEMYELTKKGKTQNLNEHSFYLDNNNQYRSDDIDIINLKKESDIFNFQYKYVGSLVAPVCDAVNSINEKIESFSPMFYHCKYCDDKVYPYDNENYPSYFFDEHAYYGTGGITSANDTVLCEECNNNRCDKCEMIINSYKEETFIIKIKDNWGVSEKYVCKDCFDDNCGAILEGEKPCILLIPYDENQINMFKEYSNSEKQVSKYINEENEQEIKDYLKKEGYSID